MRKFMPSPELIRQASVGKTDGRREELKRLETAQIFSRMRRDCEELLNTRGVVSRHPFTKLITYFTPFDKGSVLETYIPDHADKSIKVQLFSSDKDPIKSPEINLVIEGLLYFLSFQKDCARIGYFRYAGSRGAFTRVIKGSANIDDARNYREIVDALQKQ